MDCLEKVKFFGTQVKPQSMAVRASQPIPRRDSLVKMTKATTTTTTNFDLASRAPDRNGKSRLYNMLEIYHFGPEHSIWLSLKKKPICKCQLMNQHDGKVSGTVQKA